MSKFFAAIGFLAVIAGAVIAVFLLWDKYKACDECAECEEDVELEENDECLEAEVEEIEK